MDEFRRFEITRATRVSGLQLQNRLSLLLGIWKDGYGIKIHEFTQIIWYKATTRNVISLCTTFYLYLSLQFDYKSYSERNILFERKGGGYMTKYAKLFN